MHRVGLYCGWDESYEHLLRRMQWTTPGLDGPAYKNFFFVPPNEPHDYALVFNGVPQVQVPLSQTYVLIFEPVDILGADHPWLSVAHPQFGANIYSFCGGTRWPMAPGLHLPQAMLASDDVLLQKTRSCSMICSDKTITAYQLKRREVMRRLLDQNFEIDFYGRHMPLTGDVRIKGEILGELKDPALLPYLFTIDFENSPHAVLTDKFIDPLLCGAIPITNSTIASSIFPKGSFEYVDFEMSVDEIVGRIKEILNTPNLDDDLPAMKQARELITTGPLNICGWLSEQLP